MHHNDGSRSIGRPDFAANTPDGAMPVERLFTAVHRELSRCFEADSCEAVPASYLRQRRRPIADPALNLRMVDDAVEALKGTGWTFDHEPEPDPCPVSVHLKHLHPDLVAKDLFKRVKQAPLSRIQFPLQPSKQPPYTTAVRPDLAVCTPNAAATPAPVPRFKHCQLFASAVADSRFPLARQTVAFADDERKNRTSRLEVLSGRNAAGTEAVECAVADRRSARDKAMQPPAAQANHANCHLSRPDDCLSPKVSVSRFDFRLL